MKLLAVVLIAVFLGACESTHYTHDKAVDVKTCRLLLSLAHTAGDSVVVYEAAPNRRSVHSCESLLQERLQ